jgi:hypothetical protein
MNVKDVKGERWMDGYDTGMHNVGLAEGHDDRFWRDPVL